MDPALLGTAAGLVEDLARASLGFSRSAIARDSLIRAIQLRCEDELALEALVSELRARAPEALAWAEAVVTVGETYFFRHPEHFDLIASTLLPQLPRAEEVLRVWSAGCSTGEEAYSLAACLLDAAPALKIEVVGSDAIEGRLAIARAGAYARWSVRSERALHCAQAGADGKLHIRAPLRQVTRFVRHNLLTPWSGAPDHFELVVCRNVLAYMDPPQRIAVVRHLAEAVVPGGVLIVGPLDLDVLPPGFSLHAAPGANVLVRRQAPVAGLPAPPAAPRPPAAPAAPRPSGALRQHAEALGALEASELEHAAALLEDLLARWPEYLPGLCEYALVQLRRGQRARAAALMRDVAARAQALADHELVEGPEALTAGFYRRIATEFLSTHGGEA